MIPLTRRDFLQSCAALAAALMVPPIARGAASLSRANLGFSLYGMKTLPLEDAFSTCARIGYRNVELALMPGYPTEPTAFAPGSRKSARELLKALNLEISGLMVNLSLAVDDAKHQAHLETLKSAAELAHDLVPGAPPIIETVLGGKPAEWETIKDRMAERLRGWADVASTAKVTLTIKAHVGSAVNSPERLLWLLKQADNPSLAVAYDYSHFELQRIGMTESLRALLPYTRFIHVKDTAGEPPKFRFLLPGEGRTDYAAYFALLRESGYAGPIVVEVSGQIFNQAGYDPVAAAEKSYAALSKALPE